MDEVSVDIMFHPLPFSFIHAANNVHTAAMFKAYANFFSVTSSHESMFASLCLDKITWSHLRSLTLEGIYATETQLTDIIVRHKETLSDVEFRYCSLFSGTWANIVDLVLSILGIVQFSINYVNVRMNISTGFTLWHSANISSIRKQ